MAPLRYVLDANACITLLRGSSPRLAERLALNAPSDIAVPTVVVGELVHGAHVSTRAAENLRLVTNFLSPFICLPFDGACAYEYGRIRSDLKLRGALIGANDLLIAATAVANRLVLVTHGTDEFGRVTGLKLEDWE